MDLDTADEQGITPRQKYQKVVTQTEGRVVPPELQNEKKPQPEDEWFFDMFFEMYQPEQNFYQVLHAYCSMWELVLAGEDISLMQSLWKEAESWRMQRQKKQTDKSKKEQGRGVRAKPSRGRR